MPDLDAVGGRRQHRPVAGLLVLGLGVARPVDLDVEQVQLAVDRRDLAVGADVHRCVAQLVLPVDALGDRAGDEVDAQLARRRARPRDRRAVERLGTRAQVVAGPEDRPLLGQDDRARAVGSGGADLSGRQSRGCVRRRRRVELDGGGAHLLPRAIDWSVNRVLAAYPRACDGRRMPDRAPPRACQRRGRPLKRWRYVGVFGEDLMACFGARADRRAAAGLLGRRHWGTAPERRVRERTRFAPRRRRPARRRRARARRRRPARRARRRADRGDEPPRRARRSGRASTPARVRGHARRPAVDLRGADRRLGRLPRARDRVAVGGGRRARPRTAATCAGTSSTGVARRRDRLASGACGSTARPTRSAPSRSRRPWTRCASRRAARCASPRAPSARATTIAAVRVRLPPAVRDGVRHAARRDRARLGRGCDGAPSSTLVTFALAHMSCGGAWCWDGVAAFLAPTCTLPTWTSRRASRPRTTPRSSQRATSRRATPTGRCRRTSPRRASPRLS